MAGNSVAHQAASLYLRGVQVREEKPADYDAVSAVHRAAFGAHADVVIPLVADLRNSLAAEAGLSLVAVEDDGRVVGHVLFTRNLLDAPSRLVEVQVLSPVGVTPNRQAQGVGSALIRHGLSVLAESGVPAVFLEGSPRYYPRFGFVPGERHAFRRPSLRIPEAAFQVRLLPAYAPWMTGSLVYRHEFWDYDAVGPTRHG